MYSSANAAAGLSEAEVRLEILPMHISMSAAQKIVETHCSGERRLATERFHHLRSLPEAILVVLSKSGRKDGGDRGFPRHQKSGRELYHF